MPASFKHDWDAIRRVWLERNLDRENSTYYTLKRCAKDHGVKYGTLRNVATQQDWRGQLTAELRRLTDEAIARTREAAAIDEAEIRLRQIGLARMAGEIAQECMRLLQDIGTVNGDMLLAMMEPKDIINMAKLAMEQERKAAGLPEKMEHRLPGITEESEGESPAMAHLRQKILNQEVDELRAFFRKARELSEAKDVGGA